MGRRQFMNLLTFGSVTGVALGALYPVANYFIPPRAAGGGGGSSAKDELGNTVTASGWLAGEGDAGGIVRETYQSLGAAGQLQSFTGKPEEAQENAVRNSSTILVRIKELALQASSDTMNSEDRTNIASEIEGLQKDLLSLANTTDVNGNFVFGGSRVSTARRVGTSTNTWSPPTAR
jgi:hypothetical protein